MPAWLKKLGTVQFQDGRTAIGAKFRGVPFYLETAERSGGRRAVRHDYPMRDEPFFEDMGRVARSFPVEGYVLGDAYLAQRDSLIAALEEAGPGVLYHPYYGTLSVICVDFRVRESSADGGMARFGITFEETATLPAYPSSTPAPAALVATSGDALIAAIRARLASRYKTASLPSSALASLSSVVKSAAKALSGALTPVVRGTQELAALKHDLDHLVLDADGLVRLPFKVIGGFHDVLVSLGSPPLTPSLGLTALLTAYGFIPESSRPPLTTATRRQERENYDSLLWALRTLVLVQAAQLAPAADYDSYDAAVSTRDSIVERLEDQAETADDDAYAAIAQLRADLVRAVPGEATDLPHLLRHRPAYTVPSLVLAHRLYGNLAREADLVVRNRVARPGFVLGGMDLEVLSSA